MKQIEISKAHIGQQVQVYKNLHLSTPETPMYSVRDSKTRRVVGHASVVWLAGAEFRVSEAGRQRVLREKRKNVHAWVEGRLLGLEGYGGVDVSAAATYNPYRGGTFTDRASGEELLSAAVVLLDERGVRYSQ
jgi:hypothetical protein